MNFFDIQAHVFCIRRANHAVLVDLCSIDVRRPDRGIALVIDQNTTHCNADPMWIVFLWAIVNDRICIGENFLGRQGMHDLIVSHYKHGIRALLPCLVASLCHVAKIFTKSCLPHLSRCRIVHYFFRNLKLCVPSQGGQLELRNAQS
jgi:hypothetical protein